MWIKNIIFVLSISILLISCSKKDVKENVILEKSLEMQVLEAYQEGMEALNSNDVLFAAKKFNEAEILFPQSEWAPKSALMAAYSYYKQDYYGDAIAEMERFLREYPNGKQMCNQRSEIVTRIKKYPHINFENIVYNKDIYWNEDRHETLDELNKRIEITKKYLINRPKQTSAIVDHNSIRRKFIKNYIRYQKNREEK